MVGEQAHELTEQRPRDHVLDHNGVSRTRLMLGDLRREPVTEPQLGESFLTWLWRHLTAARDDESAKHVTLDVDTFRECRSQRFGDLDFPEAIGPVTRTTEPSRCELSLTMPLIVSPCSGDIPERWPTQRQHRLIAERRSKNVETRLKRARDGRNVLVACDKPAVPLGTCGRRDPRRPTARGFHQDAKGHAGVRNLHVLLKGAGLCLSARELECGRCRRMPSGSCPER